MTHYSAVKRINSPDGQRYADIEVRDDGAVYRFVEMTHRVDPDDGYEYWSPTHWSGLYADPEAAEHAARTTLAWLSDTAST